MAAVTQDDYLAILRDNSKNVIERLRAGAKLELEYWEIKEPPNGRHIFVYYVKGFFFEKQNLKGVEIQSFRLVRKVKRGLRLV